MQDDPSNTESQCYTDTANTNVEIIAMSDVTQYVSEEGYYDDAVFLNLFKIMNIKFIQQLESCEYIPFLISLDGMLSNVPQAAAAGVNLATQLGTGIGNGNYDTSVYISVDKVKEGVNDNNNWEIIGQGFQLGLSQLLKISAGDADIEVFPTGF